GTNNTGTVFQITPMGVESVLHSFGAGTDGNTPYAGLVMDASGNLYGTTVVGGTNNTGTVFKITPAGAESVLHSFGAGTDGNTPYAGLVMDASGNLYGTTSSGGANGYGTVFKITTAGVESVLHSFGSGTDGNTPLAGLVMDASGNLYGTTDAGGANNNGTVFKITP
ncbi:MAG: choice-of-anchor tandem repeat GloVer-containing protein, partial [Thiomonas sp.]